MISPAWATISSEGPQTPEGWQIRQESPTVALLPGSVETTRPVEEMLRSRIGAWRRRETSPIFGR